MDQEQAFIEKIKSVIGIEKTIEDPVEVEKGAIRKYAEATMDRNPLYIDEKFAHDLGFSGVIAPPTFICGYSYAQLFLPDLPDNLNGLHLGDEWEFHRPIQAGDKIQRKGKVLGVKEKTGRSGKMLFITFELRFTNQIGESVSVYRPTLMIRLNPLNEAHHADLL